MRLVLVMVPLLFAGILILAPQPIKLFQRRFVPESGPMSLQMSMLFPTIPFLSRLRVGQGGVSVCPELTTFLPVVMDAISSRKVGFNRSSAFLIIAPLDFIWCFLRLWTIPSSSTRIFPPKPSSLDQWAHRDSICELERTWSLACQAVSSMLDAVSGCDGV